MGEGRHSGSEGCPWVAHSLTPPADRPDFQRDEQGGGAEEGRTERGDADAACTSGVQCPSREVRAVPELPGSLEDPPADLFADVGLVVEHTRDRLLGHAGQSSDLSTAWPAGTGRT